MPRYYRNRIYDSEKFGHLKGHLEREGIKREEKLLKQFPNYPYNKTEHDKASFRIMHNNALKNQKL